MGLIASNAPAPDFLKRQLVRDHALTKNHETILCGGVQDWSIRWRDSECPEWHKQQPGHIVISH